MITPAPHFLSQVPIKIQMKFNDVNLAICTGFFYEHDEQLYLVSNWQNFSGRNPETLQPLSNHGGIPNKAKCRLILKEEILSWDDHEFALWSKDDLPIWYHHPQHGHHVDVAVMPIILPDRFKRTHINQYRFSDMRIEIAQDVFILGFPLGINGRKELPIWKRGSIASEPGGNYPRILIDTATRQCMSGSPVIMKYRGVYLANPGSNIPSDEDWFGEGELFLGVYSGRLGNDEFLAQLGVVWKMNVIEEIINAKESPQTI